MEFGELHLSVREPIVPKVSVSPRNRRSLQRRRVFVVGDWHLWVQHADWKLKTANGMLSSNHDIGTKRDEVLQDLSGQRLLSIDVIPATTKWTLVFDLGGCSIYGLPHTKPRNCGASMAGMATSWDADRMDRISGRRLLGQHERVFAIA